MSSIFPENDWEEKDVNQVVLAVLAAIRLKAAVCENKSAAASGDTDLTLASILMRSWRFSHRGRRLIRYVGCTRRASRPGKGKHDQNRCYRPGPPTSSFRGVSRRTRPQGRLSDGKSEPRAARCAARLSRRRTPAGIFAARFRDTNNRISDR